MSLILFFVFLYLDMTILTIVYQMLIYFAFVSSFLLKNIYTRESMKMNNLFI